MSSPQPSPTFSPTASRNRPNPPGAVRVSLNPAERWFYVGKTGKGKSHLARANLEIMERKGWRILIIDPKRQWMDDRTDAQGRPLDFDTAGYGTVAQPRRVERFDKHLRVMCYQPPMDVKGWQDDKLDKLLLGALEARDTIVLFDELHRMVTPTQAPESFRLVWFTGRSYNVAGWATTQRPKRIPEETKSAAENWAIFYLGKPDDKKDVAEYTDSPQIVTTKLERYWWWYYNENQMDTAVLMPPIGEGWGRNVASPRTAEQQSRPETRRKVGAA